MNVLAIRLARLGDLILLLPALVQLKSRFPNSRLTLLTDHRNAPLAEMCPAIDEVIPVDRLAMRDGSTLRALKTMSALVQDVRRRRFDLVVDFQGFRETNLLAWLSGAPQRLGFRQLDQSFLKYCFNLPPVVEDKSLHASRMLETVVESLGALDNSNRSPLTVIRTVVIPEESRQWARDTIHPGPLAVLYIDAPISARMWPTGRFAAIADRMTEHLNAQVIAIAGPYGEALVREFLSAVRSFDRIQAFSNLPISHVAAAIASARLLLSNDTGPMHLGPALGTATLGLFSVGLPEHFRPTGAGDRFLRATPMDALGVDDVWKAVNEMWAAADSNVRL